MKEEATMEKIINLAKRRGFIWPGSEIYGGMANSWDFGPLGVELKNNIKQAWWKYFVRGRLDVVGLETALIMNPKVWEASGHKSNFKDPLTECRRCHARYRADEINLNEPCRTCGGEADFTEPAGFNMMFKTSVGAKEERATEAYLRPETAQGMFVDFPLMLATSRARLPFGIAQIGKAFRNEITPGNYIFRTREFEQMEIEYFVHPRDWEAHFETWLKEMQHWIKWCGIDAARVIEVEVPKSDRAFYSKRTVDFEFKFPFGQKELYGLAYRGDYDLKLHQAASNRDFSYTDAGSGEKFLPHVVEPTFGVERTVLAVLLSAYDEEEVKGEKRVVLRLKPELAPYQAAVLPLSKKPELMQIAASLARELATEFNCEYDVTQSIGRRYRRQDEIGTPYCVTVDFESLKDQAVTIRERDSMKQERVPIDQVKKILRKKL